MTPDPAQSEGAGDAPGLREEGPPPPTPQAAPEAASRPTARSRRDRWAHRRGEPRLFVFLWTTYLFSATLLTLAAVSASGHLTADMYRPAARLLVATVVAGVVLLWPMVRLSQVLPAGDPRGGAGFASAVQDYFVVMLPAQAVIWPQWSLAALPGGVVAALGANVAAWGLVVGGLLAHALTSAGPGRPDALGSAHRLAGRDMTAWARVVWMLVFVAVAAAGAAGALLAWAGDARATVPPARPAWMLSPLTAVFELLADRSWTGRSAAVTGMHWRATGVTAAAGLTLWLVAWARVRGVRWGRGGRTGMGLH